MAALQNQAWNRRLYDGCKTTDDLRVTTGPGRYQLDAPPQYCNACFAPEPTVRQQSWGASLNGTYTKTDVESDLLNINRPSSRTVCNQYNPAKDKINKGGVAPVKECSFPQTHSRLVDPPCTLRSSGWNRWEWLCENPQAGVMMPFDNLVTTRLAAKDQHRPCIPKPIDSEQVLPAPAAYGKSTPFEGLETGALGEVKASVARALTQFPRGEDSFPAAGPTVFGIEPAPIHPPALALAKHGALNNL
jgi:hypothetical protein